MTDVTITNSPVSADLLAGESVTVPAGEVWSVTMAIGFGAADESNGNHCIAITVNGTGAHYNHHDGGSSTGTSGDAVETVVVDGDLIEVSADAAGANSGAHISGFVVS